MKVGIDASNLRSGGGLAHIKGILTSLDPRKCGVTEVHIWSYSDLLQGLPEAIWLIKHSSPEPSKGLIIRTFWQFFLLPRMVNNSCDILLIADAGSVSSYSPSIVMSRDMLSFEKSEIDRFKWTKQWIRLVLIKYIQISSLKKSTAVLFLTKYAANTIQKYTGDIDRVRIIPHGISDNFRMNVKNVEDYKNKIIKCVYISASNVYKHQWNVIEGVSILKKQGFSIELTLVGAGSGYKKSVLKTLSTVRKHDPDMEYIKVKDFIPHQKVPCYLKSSDVFIFASSCENMPNTLIEAMASGLPIVSSDRGPMPEVLERGGLYFNPEDSYSIADALKKIITVKSIRNECTSISKERSDLYSWERCAKETWGYLGDTLKDFNRINNK